MTSHHSAYPRDETAPHAYTNIGVSTRAGAASWAMQSDVVS